MTIRIIYKSRWRDATIQAQSSEHPQYPAEDSQLDILAQPFRTRHGTDSGNGLFVIDANNKYIPDVIEKKGYFTLYKTSLESLEQLCNTTSLDFMNHTITLCIEPNSKYYT